MSTTQDGWVVVEEKRNPMWDCCNNRDANGNKIGELPVTDKSWIMGYLLGSRQIKMKNDKVATVHDLQLIDCGDMAHINQSVEKGSEVSIWGQLTIDEKIRKDVPLGVAIKVTWKGKVASQSNKGQAYHIFELAQNPNMVLTGFDGKQMSDFNTPQESAPQQLQTQDNNSSVLDDDSDLPF